MLTKLARDLEGVGFGEKEARVYLTLLEHGALRVQQIANHSGVNRSTAYLALSALLHRGIVSCGDQDGSKCYIAESPAHLERILELEKRRHTEASERIRHAMPHFFAIWNAIEHKPSVRFFEGEKGMEQCRELMLRLAPGSESLHALVHYDSHILRAANQDERLRLRFSSGRFRMRVLYSIEDGLNVPSFGKNAELRSIKHIPEFAGEINISSHFVFMGVPKPVITAIVIENASIARLFQSFFDIAWEAADKKEDRRRIVQ